MATVICDAAKATTHAAAAPPGRERAHIHHLENFRAVAILLVVGSHCYALAWPETALKQMLNNPMLNLVSGATALFVFASGFFFHHVFRGEFSFTKFLADKSKRLLPPYVAVTLLLILLARSLGESMEQLHGATLLWEQVAVALVNGSAGPAMWYIPFIFLVFLLSPLCLRFIAAEGRTQAVVLAALLLLACMVNRSPYNADKIQNVLYFGFYYAFGIVCSTRRQAFERLVRRPGMTPASLAIVVVLSFWQGVVGGTEPTPPYQFSWDARDLLYLQKIALILLLCGLLARFADRPVAGLSLVARWSFGIYFLHQFALLLCSWAARLWEPTSGNAYLDFTLWWAAVFALSVLLVWGGQRLLGARSRYLIGA